MPSTASTGSPRTVCVRINDVETEWCHDDIIEVVTGAGAKLDTIMLTKAKSATDVMFVHLMLDQLEKKLGLENGASASNALSKRWRA